MTDTPSGPAVPPRVLALCGSLRVGSFNRMLLRAAEEVAGGALAVTRFDIGPLPPYDQDVEAKGDPEVVARLKQAIREADGLLVASPEYNYGIPGVLKNAIDWASRPPAATPLKGQPAAIMGASAGMGGTIRMQAQLRQTFHFTETLVMLKPEVYVARAQDRFDAAGRLTDEATRTVLKTFVEAFAVWIRRVRAMSAAS